MVPESSSFAVGNGAQSQEGRDEKDLVPVANRHDRGSGVGHCDNSRAKQNDQQQIVELERGLIAATNAKNVNEMMSYYDGTDQLIIFDAVPPLKYSGTQAWRKNLEGFVTAYNPGILELTELVIETDGKLGYAHSIQHFTGTDRDGKQVVMAFRVTDCLKKERGKWKIAHEHNSMPIDYASGKAFLNAPL